MVLAFPTFSNHSRKWKLSSFVLGWGGTVSHTGVLNSSVILRALNGYLAQTFLSENSQYQSEISGPVQGVSLFVIMCSENWPLFAQKKNKIKNK